MKDSWTATASSAIIVPANGYRGKVVIQKTAGTVVAIGIGEAAEAGKGIQLLRAGDTLEIEGADARKAIYAIGNTGAGTYQEGTIKFIPGPTPAAG